MRTSSSRTGAHEPRERAALVGLFSGSSRNFDPEHSLDDLAGLAAAGVATSRPTRRAGRRAPSHTRALERGRAPFRLGYRPQLDGVRGIAVILVVVYHVGRLLWPEASGWLAPGGFLGVDLFFVLSGFLIASLLLAEAEQHIARYKLPKDVLFLDAIQRSPSGKADYRWAKATAETSVPGAG